MTKPCPPDLEAFKHEPADYEQPVEAVTVELLSCPFCGEQCADLVINQGTKWAHYEPSCLEVRTGYDLSADAEWRGAAIAAWNTRTQATEAMREALEHWDAQATRWLESREQHARPGWMQPAIDKARRALSGDSARPQANEAMREALERIAATDFDSPPWQAVEAEIKQIALSALSGDRA